MKRLLLSTAMLGALAVPAVAQDQTIFREAPDALEIRASDFMGMRVYASEAAVEGEEIEGIQEGWEDVGEIGDIVMDRDGTVQAVLVDIGGFLGIGERTVAVSMDALRLVSDSETAEDVNDFFLVMNANREALEGAPEYVDAQVEGMSAEEAATETDEAIEEGASNVAAAGAAVGAAAGAAVGSAVRGTENAAEEAGDEIAEAGAEVADEAADAGEEVSEEVAQAELTDTQEDSAEAADDSADAAEEATEESAEATEDTAEEGEVTVTTTESEPQTEVVTEETTETDAATETEMAAEETAEAATTEEADVTEEPATTEDAAAQTPAEAPARAPLEREGFVAAGVEDFAADRLQGAAVYDANDERVGEVGEILLSDDGQVSDLVVDVGGFLGLGEKPVALPMTSLDILRQDGGEEIRVYVSQTEEELEAMERFESQ